MTITLWPPVAVASAVPLPSTNRRRMCLAGDSFVAGNSNAFGGQNNTFFSNFTILNSLAGWPFTFSNADTFAVSGGTLANIIANLPSIVAGGYELCVVQGCHNDFISGQTLAQVVANYETIFSTLIGAGITPICVLGPPLNSNESSTYVTLAQLRLLILESNVWKRNYCAQNNIPVWDWATAMSDLTSSGAGYASGYTDDSIHPNLAANFAAAKQGLIDLSAIIPPSSSNRLVTTANDAFDATYNLYGNIMPNGLMWSSGGTLNAGNMTGTLAGSFSVIQDGTYTNAGGSAVASLVASSDGIGQWQQFAFSGTTTGGGDVVDYNTYQFINQGSIYSPGDVLESWIQVNVLANSPFETVALLLIEQNRDNSQVQNTAGLSQFGGGGDLGPTYAWSGILKTAPLTVPQNSPTGSNGRILFPQFKVGFNAAANNFSGTIQFRRWTIRKVPQF